MKGNNALNGRGYGALTTLQAKTKTSSLQKSGQVKVNSKQRARKRQSDTEPRRPVCLCTQSIQDGLQHGPRAFLVVRGRACITLACYTTLKIIRAVRLVSFMFKDSLVSCLRLTIFL